MMKIIIYILKNDYWHKGTNYGACQHGVVNFQMTPSEHKTIKCFL